MNERQRGDTRITRTCINATCINAQALVSPLFLSHLHLGTPLFIAHASHRPTRNPHKKRRGGGREREAQHKRSAMHEEKEKRRHQDKEDRSESEAQGIRKIANTTCMFQSFYLCSAKRKRRASQRSFEKGQRNALSQQRRALRDALHLLYAQCPSLALEGHCAMPFT